MSGESTVLIIADTLRNAQPLADLLSQENKVTTTTAIHAPSTLVELCKYDAVVMSNVYYYALPNGFEKILQEYVGSHGRTLVAVGGKDTFMYGEMQDTLLQDMLPVTLSLEGSVGGNSVALMLVLDCSSSMVGGNLSVAKQGAINTLYQSGAAIESIDYGSENVTVVAVVDERTRGALRAYDSYPPKQREDWED